MSNGLVLSRLDVLFSHNVHSDRVAVNQGSVESAQEKGQMMVIWKFDIPKTTRGIVQVPRGATVLDVQSLSGWGVFWAICDPSAPMVDRTVVLVGTGTDDPLPPSNTYIGTFQANWFVGHVFLEPEGDK